MGLSKRRKGAAGAVEPAAVPQAFLQRLLWTRNNRYCLADWENICGLEFGRIRSMLVKCIGELTKSYPAPGSWLRLEVGRRDDCFIAFPTGDFDADADDMRLTEQDVQMWRLDWAQVEAEFGEGLEMVKLSSENAQPSPKISAAPTTLSREEGELIADKAAKKVLAGVEPALSFSRLKTKQTANQNLVVAFTRERRKHATDSETFEVLAQLDISTARATGKAPWLRLSVAKGHQKQAVKGELLDPVVITDHADALERRYYRALEYAKRTPSEK